MYQFLCFCASSLLFLTCTNQPSNTEASADYTEMAQSTVPESRKEKVDHQSIDQSSNNKLDQKKENVIPEKIIRNANISLEVDDVNKSKSSLDETIKSYDAYYEREAYNASDYRSNYDIVIRVPSENFVPLLTAIESGDGYVQSKQVSAQNVTEEYIDVSLRLKNSQRYLEQYNVILKKARSIKEILEVQEKIRKLEEEIEARKGRLKYLDNQVGLSSIRLNLFQQNKRVQKSKGFFARAADSLLDGFKLLESLALFILTIWPLILIGVVIFFFRKRIFTWSSKKKNP